MQTSNETNLLFWDRLKQLSREKADGEVVDRGEVGGRNVLRLMRGQNGGAFLTVNCIMQELLSANTTAWPSSVSDDGLTVSLWLTDFSSGRKGYRRKFMLTFFDELAASRFFESYTLSLPSRAGRGLSFQEMVEDEENGGFGAEEDDSEEEEEVDKNREQVKKESGGTENDDEGGQEDTQQSKDQEGATGSEMRISDDFAAVLALEQEMPWGESQDLFNPQYPDF